MICCQMYFEIFGRPRRTGIINIVYFILMTISTYGIAVIFSQLIMYKIISVILVIAFIMAVRYDISFKKSFILAILYEGILLAADYLAFSFCKKFISSEGYAVEYYSTEILLIVVFGKMIFFLFIVVLKKIFLKQETTLLTDSEWIRYLLFPVFTIGCVMAMISAFSYIVSEEQANLIMTIAVGMFGMNLLVFHLIHDILKREIQLHENKRFLIQAENQVALYQSIADKFEYHKRRTHEYKNQLICMKGLLNTKKYEKALLYVEEVSGGLNQQVDAIDTNHAIVNAILNAKYEEAVKNDILFVVQVNNLSRIPIKEQDIVVILSNLLDNAIEACMYCTGEKKIKLKVIDEGERITIAVCNTYAIAVLYENGTIVSSKLARYGEHGIGLQNIMRTVKKYGGSHVITHSNTEFKVSIVIPK